MGLDMYLTKETFIWNRERDKLRIECADRPHIKSERVQYIVEEVGYWRKANQIHNWFVENIADGVDNCQKIDVTIAQLKDLLKTVNTVLKASKLIKGKIKNGQHCKAGGEWEDIIEYGKYIEDPSVAQELLPTIERYFFGSTDYNQWYYEDLIDTKKIIETILKEDPEGRHDYYYQASW